MFHFSLFCPLPRRLCLSFSCMPILYPFLHTIPRIIHKYLFINYIHLPILSPTTSNIPLLLSVTTRYVLPLYSYTCSLAYITIHTEIHRYSIINIPILQPATSNIPVSLLTFNFIVVAHNVARYRAFVYLFHLFSLVSYTNIPTCHVAYAYFTVGIQLKYTLHVFSREYRHFSYFILPRV